MFVIVRRSSLLALAVVLAGCAPGSSLRANPAPTPVPAATGAPAATASPAVETVRLGVLGSATDAGVFIALDQGYFHEQGLALDLTPFDSAARMVAPLGAGQLDIGGGSHRGGSSMPWPAGSLSSSSPTRAQHRPGTAFKPFSSAAISWRAARCRTLPT